MPSLLVPVLSVLGSLLVLGSFLVLDLALYAWKAMCHKPAKSLEEARDLLIAKGEIQPEWLSWPWLEARVKSPGGYSLAVRGLKARPDRLALIHHGVGWNWYGALKYGAFLYKEGWSVVLLDSRGHGGSGGRGASLGVHEARDLGPVLSWAREALGLEAHAPTLLMGISLGAATSLIYGPMDPEVVGVVADSSFSSARAVLAERLRSFHLPPLLRRITAALVDLVFRAFEDFSLDEADPGKASLGTQVPILFIHGEEDRLVPPAMSQSMAEERRARLPGARTELLLVEGADHAKGHRIAPEAYEASLLSFVRSLPGLGAEAR